MGALAEARALGFLGPGPLEAHVDSASAFIEAIGDFDGSALDLGSGGGIPGLVLAAHYGLVSWTLLDISRRRTSFLARTVALLGWSERVTVLRESADVAARSAGLRGSASVVVVRSFGPPAVTAECATGFLRVDGRLAVAEPPPPFSDDRWDNQELERLGLRQERTGRVAVFRQVFACPEDAPRSWRSIQRTPLW